MLKCSRCQEFKEEDLFNIDRSKKRGKSSYCKQCKKERESETRDSINSRQRKYYKLNKEKYKQYSLKIDHKEKYKKTIEKNPYYYRNKYNKNIAKYRFYYRNRQLLRKNATPKWADLEKIKILYEKAVWLEQLTGLKYHVDHVIPLNGKDVCGLHIWENLQILEASINISKSNNIIGDI